MRPRPDTPAPARGSEAARRLGLCSKSRPHAIKAGLKVVSFGRWQYTTSRWVREFVEGLANQQPHNGNGHDAQGGDTP